MDIFKSLFLVPPILVFLGGTGLETGCPESTPHVQELRDVRHEVCVDVTYAISRPSHYFLVSEGLDGLRDVLLSSPFLSPLESQVLPREQERFLKVRVMNDRAVPCSIAYNRDH